MVAGTDSVIGLCDLAKPANSSPIRTAIEIGDEPMVDFATATSYAFVLGGTKSGGKAAPSPKK
jgi:hypothetical protein